MKKLLFSLLLSVVSISYVYAQCGPYGCPLPGARRNPPRPYIAPPSETPQSQLSQAVRDKILAASVKVASPRNRMMALGSGTLVRYGDHIAVFTAGHVPEGQELYIWSQTIPRTRCLLRGISREPDWAILEPVERQETLYDLAVDLHWPGYHADFGDVVLCGYDGAESPRIWVGRILGMHGPESWQIEIAGPARSGDSGGGVFDLEGKLLAIIWGSDFYRTTFATDRAQPIYYIQRKGETGCFGWRRPRPQPPAPSPAPQPSPKPEAPKAKPKPEAPKVEPKPEPKPEHVPEHKPQPESDGKLPIIRAVLDFLKPTLYVLVGWLAFLPVLTVTRIILAFK